MQREPCESGLFAPLIQLLIQRMVHRRTLALFIRVPTQAGGHSACRRLRSASARGRALGGGHLQPRLFCFPRFYHVVSNVPRSNHGSEVSRHK